MKKFSDFNIQPKSQGFKGQKIKINKILNREIIVHDFKIEPSKYQKNNEKCLHLSIEISGTMHVIFTGSTVLMDIIQKVDKANFPFTTTIIEENEHYEFR